MGWISNPNYNGEEPYNGILSMPRILYLENGTIKSKPLKEHEQLLNNGKIVDKDIEEEFK